MSAAEYAFARSTPLDTSRRRGSNVSLDSDDDLVDPADVPTHKIDCVEVRKASDKFDDYAMQLRHYLNEDGYETSTYVEIRSAILRKALQIVLEDYSYISLTAIPIRISKPYHALFHYRKELRDYASDEERTSEEKQHLRVLIDFLDKNLSKIERQYNESVPSGMITFELLWTIFRAEDEILLRADHFEECYRVIDSKSVMADTGQYFQIWAWRWGYNGVKFGPEKRKINITEFRGYKRIDQLEVYPLRMVPPEQQAEKRVKLITSGHIWRTLVERAHREYDGRMWTDPTQRAESMKELVMFHEKGRIMLDHEEHEKQNYRLATILHGSSGELEPRMKHRTNSSSFLYSRRKSNQKGDWEIDNKTRGTLNTVECELNTPDYKMTDEQALLCPAFVRGFALSSKRWGFFLVEHVQDVTWRDSFDQLELDTLSKDMVRALVGIHGSNDDEFDDFVYNKGRGLIFLLHGPPGSGKTLTAESIAEHTKRPLYSLSTGELGLHARDAEQTLQEVFDLASLWNAVLLLDEADLFLSKRTSDDMARNAFVTVFIRLLEYYRGILFLTTNRVEEFDPAFHSRIHRTIPYPNLDATKRARIWKNLLSEEKRCAGWSDEMFNRLGCRFELNGREIKNLIKITLSVTKYNKTTLDEEAFASMYTQ